MTKKADLSLQAGLEARINKLKLVHYIAVEMNKAHTTNELLEFILERCLVLTGAKTGSVMLTNRDEGVLDIIAFKGIDEKVARRTKLKIGEGITGWAAQSGLPKLVNNTRQDPLYVAVTEGLLSEIAVPIRSENEIIGVISIDSNKEDAFSEEDLELITMVSELAAQIIIRQEMGDRLHSKMMLQETLIETFNIIEEGDDIKVIFDSIMEVLREKMDILRGMFVLFDKDDPLSLKVEAGYKISGEAMKKGIYKIGEGVIGNAVLKGQTIGIQDIEKEEMFLNRLKIQRAGMGQISFIAAPIKAGANVLGVIAVERKFSDAENFDDITDTLTLLASLLAYRVRSHQRQEEATKKLIDENTELRKELKTESSVKNIVGKNETIRKVMEQVKTVAGTMAPVLITGETGTGKELIAKVVHFLSDRSDKKIISVNCAAIPENLLESELFGYEKGAFTGAAARKKGRFEIADGGTLFLDEVGEIPLHLQSKLLRAIQEKEIEPLGSEKPVKVDIRIISATNRDLEKLSAEGKFRSDLYFRLNVINVKLPSLKERKDDIPLLSDFFIKKFNKMYGKNVMGLDKKTEDMFVAYEWPGNIRELENALERAVIMSKGNLIDISLVPDSINAGKKTDKEDSGIKGYLDSEIYKASEGEIYAKVIGGMEKRLMEEMLIKTDYNKSKTAEMLGINRNTLKAKMKEFGL
ncbi:MAG: transcriptional regulator [Candidatus Goldiibacteriota bacterium HGW-Goldbacteria-1]|jgi:Nif-specific regulatory protein|nr:MAG: transcriptional regulator [Candidatus Goldiibacteriota bacterium HGW-Goldbacteria-1]